MKLRVEIPRTKLFKGLYDMTVTLYWTGCYHFVIKPSTLLNSFMFGWGIVAFLPVQRLLLQQIEKKSKIPSLQRWVQKRKLVESCKDAAGLTFLEDALVLLFSPYAPKKCSQH